MYSSERRLDNLEDMSLLFSARGIRSVIGLTLALSLGVKTGVCADSSPEPEGVTSRLFGETPQREPVMLHTLTNKNGMSVSIMDYGATIVRIMVPDRSGKLADVTLGFDRLAPYFHQTAFFGAVVGRYGNRIARGQFELNRMKYQLTINDPPNSLHGGRRGFDKQVWKEEAVDSDTPAIRFSLLSPDGDQGYPGNLFASVTYTLSEENELRISYQATCDKPTVINLTNHTYFNLAGGGTVFSHLLTIHGDRYLPVDATLIPTGELVKVDGTPWDFLQPTAMGLHLKEAGGKPIGFDHTFVLEKGFFSNWALAAEVEEPTTGRTLKVYSDQPGIQFYTGNFLDGTLRGKEGKVYRQYAGFCLEPQHFPDSPNRPDFPSTVLSPGDTYQTATVLEFGVK
jgi:aldose 1-epimerase